MAALSWEPFGKEKRRVAKFLIGLEAHLRFSSRVMEQWRLGLTSDSCAGGHFSGHALDL